MTESKIDQIVLINESKRAWTFPARVVPADRSKLTSRKRPPPRRMPDGRDSLVELEKLETYRAPILDVPSKDDPASGRIRIPAWYFEELMQIDGLRAVFNKRDGIAVGRTRAESLAARTAEQEAELVAQAEIEKEARAAAERRVAELERELASRPDGKVEKRLADAEAAEREAAAKAKAAEDRAKKLEADLAKSQREVAKLEEKLTTPKNG